MRWRRREGPWGSHQLEARALKCETSVGSTVPVVEEEGLWLREDEVVKHRDAGAIDGRRVVYRGNSPLLWVRVSDC